MVNQSRTSMQKETLYNHLVVVNGIIFSSTQSKVTDILYLVTHFVVSGERREATRQEGCRADIESYVCHAVVAPLQLRQHVPDVAHGVSRVSWNR